jgi:toxin ParE1/3/4
MAHRIVPRARGDLDQIWDYIFTETGNEAAADRAVDAIIERFVLLSRWPRIGRARDDLRRGLRSHPAGDYLIFYRISRGGVVILRVLHGRRDIPPLFRSER